MTQERKNRVYDQMIVWICEHIGDDDELYCHNASENAPNEIQPIM